MNDSKICLACGMEFKNQRSLNSHLKVHDENYKKPIPPKIKYTSCKFCDKKISKANIKKHEKSCNSNPINYKYCKNCNQLLTNHKNIFCSQSCATKYNNSSRPSLSKETKMKISNTLKNRTSSWSIRGSCRLFEHTCSICGRFALVNYKQNQRKTCSRKCQIIASTSRSYQNGSRKTTLYFNKTQNKEIILESSWEVKIAELLDSLKIEWIRPLPIEWIDKNFKNHLYYPDFYLLQHNVYLDPKNPYCMEKDKEKMEVVSKNITIVYGDINIVEQYILSEYSDLN